MRILCITQRYYPVIGGAENLIKTYVDFLALKNEITVFTSNSLSLDSFWNKTDDLIPNYKLDYPVKRFNVLIPSEVKNYTDLKMLPLQSNYPGPYMPNLWTELLGNELKYDLIIVTAFPYDHVIPAFVAAKKWNIPIIAIPLIHDEFPELFMTGMKLSLLSCANTILVLSRSEKLLLTELGFEASKIQKINPYIKKQNFDKNEISLFLKKYNLENKKTILFTGTKSSVKGIITLIESMKKIWKIYDDVILLLIGPSTNEYRKYYRKLSKNIKNKIVDLEIIDDKTKNLAFESCNIFALPSKSESFGIVIIEAWIHKKPVIGCNISSTKELINHMENGLLVSFNEIGDLSDYICKLLENETLGKNLGKKGFEKSNRFTNPNNLTEFEEICLKTINQFQSNISN